MTAQALRTGTKSEQAPQASRQPSAWTKRSRIVRLPGPEALLHPRAAEALIAAFRPLSAGR